MNAASLPATPRDVASLGGVGTCDEAALGDSALDDAFSVELARVHKSISILRDTHLAQFNASQLMDAAREVEAVSRSLYGVQLRLASELSKRGIDEFLGARSTPHLLSQALRVTVGEAKSRIDAANLGLATESLTGAVIQPLFQALTDAIDEGVISQRHADVMTSCAAALPREVDDKTRGMCMEVLLTEARHSDPNRLRRVAEQIRLICDPDGTLTDEEPFDRAELHFGPVRRDGLTPYRGLADPLTMAQLRAAVDDLSRPCPIDDKTPDPRPMPMRRAQAFHEVLRRYLVGAEIATPSHHATTPKTTEGPAVNGEPPSSVAPRNSVGQRNPGSRPQLGITINITDILGHLGGSSEDNQRSGLGAVIGDSSRIGAGQFDDGSPASYRTTQLLACDSDLIRLLMGADSAILDQGRAVRLFTRAQRRALIARDKGCAFPGCDIPATWCEAHHITYWSDGGKSDVANGILLCRRHHTIIHKEHWRISIPGLRATPAAADVRYGVPRERPWFIPPSWIDPQQRPRRNNHFFHHQILSAVSRR